jgi:hypothetical protein
MEDGKNFAAFYITSVGTCLNFRQNSFEFRAPETKCLVSGGILSVFSRR